MKEQSVSSRKRGPHALSDSVPVSVKQQGCKVTAVVKTRGGGGTERGGPVTHDKECAQAAPSSSPKNVEKGPTGLALQCELTEKPQRPGDPLAYRENSHKEKTHHFVLLTAGTGKRKEEV